MVSLSSAAFNFSKEVAKGMSFSPVEFSAHSNGPLTAVLRFSVTTAIARPPFSFSAGLAVHQRSRALSSSGCNIQVVRSFGDGGDPSLSRSAAFGVKIQVFSKRQQIVGITVRGRRSRRGETWIVKAGMNVGYEFEDALGALILPPPPEPVLFPRKMLNMKFAVLLMRSAYEAVDALDFIPMNKFQVKFWKLRQSEVEPYTLQCQPLRVKYGDLTDPLYFDFISFAQFATISNEMTTGENVFQEKLGSEGELQTVRRDERLKDNAMLPAAFNEKAGSLLYQQLLQGFEGEEFNAPPPCPLDSEFPYVMAGVKKLLQVFVDRGYALKASIEPVQSSSDNHGGKLRVRMEGSATQWGLRALASRRALLLNDFAALAVGAYLQASDQIASHKVRYSDTYIEQLWTIA